MELTLPDGEPEFGPWRVVSLEQFIGLAGEAMAGSSRRPLVLAIDGRSSSGKTTLATRVRERVDGAMIVHTDDIAWAHSRFGWTDLLIEGVLRPLREHGSVRFRPPAWDERGRPGAIEVSADPRLVIVKGVGANDAHRTSP